MKDKPKGLNFPKGISNDLQMGAQAWSICKGVFNHGYRDSNPTTSFWIYFHTRMKPILGGDDKCYEKPTKKILIEEKEVKLPVIWISL